MHAERGQRRHQGRVVEHPVRRREEHRQPPPALERRGDPRALGRQQVGHRVGRDRRPYPVEHVPDQTTGRGQHPRPGQDGHPDPDDDDRHDQRHQQPQPQLLLGRGADQQRRDGQHREEQQHRGGDQGDPGEGGRHRRAGLARLDQQLALDGPAGRRTAGHHLAGRAARQLRAGHGAPAHPPDVPGLVGVTGVRLEGEPGEPPQGREARRLEQHQQHEPPQLHLGQPRPRAEERQQTRGDDVQADARDGQRDGSTTPATDQCCGRRHQGSRA